MQLVDKVRRRIQTTAAKRDLDPETQRVVAERLSYLTPVKLRSLERAMSSLDGVEGGLVETGVALGGSAILLAQHAQATGRTFDGYDVFGMIPPPTAEDPPEVHERYATIAAGRSEGINGDDYYGYRDDLYDFVTGKFVEHGVPTSDSIRLHKGLFEDTLYPTGPVALAHIDCDWHDPVKLCLERIYPHLSPGGLVILDDYYDYGGCKKATDNFLRGVDLTVVSDQEHLVLRR